jgi:hypothetical protein
MTSELSAAVRRLAIKHALICTAGVFAAWLAAFLGFAVVLGRSRKESFLFGFALVIGVVYALGLRKWLRGRRRAGGLLLDCGPHPWRQSSLISAACFFLLGVEQSLLGRDLMKVFGYFFILQAITMALLASRHVHLREHGLWNGMGLLPWDKIESYWWDGDWTLMLIARGNPWSFKKGVFFIRPELREAADRLLRTMVPAA